MSPCHLVTLSLAPLYTAAARLLPHIPPAVAYPLCTLAGVLGPYLPPWRAILANLEIVAPAWSAAGRERAARRVLADLTKNYYELFRNPSLPIDRLVADIVFDGAEHVEAALAGGRGVIVVAPHTGTYSSIVPVALQRFEARALLIVEQLADPAVHDVVNRLRRVPRLEVVALGPAAGRVALRTLRAGQIVALGADRAIASSTEAVEFFGRPTSIPSGPATLAVRTGAPLVPATIWRRSDNRTWIRFEPPLVWQSSGDRQRDVRDVTQKIAYHMQQIISRAPSQWMVAEQVWPEQTTSEGRAHDEADHPDPGL